MSRALVVHAAGPGLTVQDGGRPGFLALGLSRGGAADRLALAEGAALLGQDEDLAVLEMAGAGGSFEVAAPARIALTGAPMRADCGGAALAWNASHHLPAGARFNIGPALAGVYGYLHVGGGIATPPHLGSRSAHLSAGIGAPVAAGDRLPLGEDPRDGDAGRLLPVEDRWTGGTVRVVPSLQTNLFPPDELECLQSCVFRRGARGNRMGVRLVPEGPPLRGAAGLSILSEVVVPGDVQITGDGTPFVLLCECQTTGGYPRIATVLPCDLPIVAQAPPDAPLRFRMVTLDEAIAAERQAAARRADLRHGIEPLVRNPHDMADLLAYQLISGVTAGRDDGED